MTKKYLKILKLIFTNSTQEVRTYWSLEDKLDPSSQSLSETPRLTPLDGVHVCCGVGYIQCGSIFFLNYFLLIYFFNTKTFLFN